MSKGVLEMMSLACLSVTLIYRAGAQDWLEAVYAVVGDWHEVVEVGGALCQGTRL